MLIKIVEGNGLQTFLFEGNSNILNAMDQFFKNEIGLATNIISDDDIDLTIANHEDGKNQQRAKLYRNEFYSFGVEPLKAIK